MKKLFIALMLLVTSITAMSQEIPYRNGNRYYFRDYSLNRKDFCYFLAGDNIDEDYYYAYKNGLDLSYAGWVAFGVGGGLGMIGYATIDVSRNSRVGIIEDHGIVHVFKYDDEDGVKAGKWIMGVGAASVVAGVVCLIVGYRRMHDAADSFIYNGYKKTAELKLISQPDQIGLAIAF